MTAKYRAGVGHSNQAQHEQLVLRTHLLQKPRGRCTWNMPTNSSNRSSFALFHTRNTAHRPTVQLSCSQNAEHFLGSFLHWMQTQFKAIYFNNSKQIQSTQVHNQSLYRTSAAVSSSTYSKHVSQSQVSARPDSLETMPPYKFFYLLT